LASIAEESLSDKSVIIILILIRVVAGARPQPLQVPRFQRARLVFSLLLLVLLVLLLPLNLTPFAEMLPARSPLTGATSGVRACECIFAHEPLRQGLVPPRVVCLVQRPVLYERLHERTTSQRSSIKYNNASPYKRQAGSWDRAMMQIPTSDGSSLYR